MICVSQNGSLKKCSSNSTSENIFEKRIFRLKTDDHFIKGKQVHDGRKNKSEIADIVNEKEHILSWKHKNLTHLCAVKQNKQNGEEFAYCSRDASIKACFGTESGRIDRCNALRETEIIVPVCVMVRINLYHFSSTYSRNIFNILIKLVAICYVLFAL